MLRPGPNRTKTVRTLLQCERKFGACHPAGRLGGDLNGGARRGPVAEEAGPVARDSNGRRRVFCAVEALAADARRAQSGQVMMSDEIAATALTLRLALEQSNDRTLRHIAIGVEKRLRQLEEDMIAWQNSAVIGKFARLPDGAAPANVIPIRRRR